MRTSILQVVTPDLAEVVTGLDAPTAARLTAAAERVTLLGRRARGPRTELRYHPLVREFLEARLARDYGREAVRDLHRTVAAHAESRDWRIAAHHHWAGGRPHEAHEIIDASAQSIIGRGEYLRRRPVRRRNSPSEEQRASFAGRAVAPRLQAGRHPVGASGVPNAPSRSTRVRCRPGKPGVDSAHAGDAVAALKAAQAACSRLRRILGWLGIGEGSWST